MIDFGDNIRPEVRHYGYKTAAEVHKSLWTALSFEPLNEQILPINLALNNIIIPGPWDND